MKTILVSGAIANKPLNGGEPWIRLSWVLGLRRLGFRVIFVEQVAAPVNIPWFQKIVEQFGLDGTVALIGEDCQSIYGIPLDELLTLAKSAELLVNISGHLTVPELKEAPRRRAFIDEDPGYTQIWHSQGIGADRLAGHDVFFTLAQNIGRPDCAIPTVGIDWRPILPPVVLELWPPCETHRDDMAFTTVGSWRGAFGPLSHDGKTYGVKAHQFRRFLELPRRADHAFELALNIHPADGKDLSALRDHGWHIVDPQTVAADPIAFRDYVQRSYAEFSVAQGVYVETRSGWFSDRTARYLASGKPALVQETGSNRVVPVGEGLISFSNPDEAMAGVEKIRANYARHCRAARKIVEGCFDSDKVLGGFLQQVDLAP